MNLKANDTAQYITQWLLQYATQAKVNGYVIGISGGVDSALTSTLCAQTGLPTLCLEMPIHQAPSQVNRAKEHIQALKAKFPNVTSAEVNLTPVFEQFKAQVHTSDNPTLLNLTLANTRARLRMTTLYYYAGLHQRLVSGTGNKIEDFGVGFFTKYGDGGVDVSPIADLLKSEVFQLAQYVGVPESILNAKPTDGLFGDDRSDEDQLGASYNELEWAMEQTRLGKTRNEFTDRQQIVFDIYTRLNRINQHKMNPIPVCIVPENIKY